MPSPVPGQLIAQVEETRGVIASAVSLISGIAARIQAAVEAAIANGATAAELEPVTAEIALLKADSDALAAAVAANP
jgi:hypothetical protein